MSKKELLRLYTDEQVVRIIAAQIVVITLLSLVFQLYLILIFLAIDFILRAFSILPSPLAFIAKFISHRFKLEPKPIFAAPKKFASGIGLVFALTTAFLIYFEYFEISYIVGSILIFFAFLESALKICVGCYVYDWIVAPYINKNNRV